MITDEVRGEGGSLAGLTGLVTGASGGIGGAIAESLARSGVTVGLVGRRASALGRLAHRIGVRPDHVFPADLTSDATLRATSRLVLQRFGRLDILVHSSGIHAAGPLEAARVADFDRLWATNVRVPFLLTQSLLPALRRSSGQIVFVNSSVGLTTRSGVGQYSATQHAARALAETFRIEVNPAGIRVLTVFPGRTATRMQERIFRAEGRTYDPDKLLQPAAVAAVVVNALSLPRSAEVTDIHIRPTLKP